jgi:tRNA(fMet)-specific endonuclease VapC
VGLVIDTSALVAFERSGRGLTDALSKLGEETVVLPAIVLAEVLAGVQLADTPARAAARRAKIDALTKRVPVVPFGPATAEHWAAVFAALQRAGTPIPANDPYGRLDGTGTGFRCSGRSRGRSPLPQDCRPEG